MCTGAAENFFLTTMQGCLWKMWFSNVFCTNEGENCISESVKIVLVSKCIESGMRNTKKIFSSRVLHEKNFFCLTYVVVRKLKYVYKCRKVMIKVKVAQNCVNRWNSKKNFWRPCKDAFKKCDFKVFFVIMNGKIAFL